MPREYGRVEAYAKGRSTPPRWRAIAYKGKGESKIGEYETREEAVDALQAHIRKGKQR